MKNLLLKVLINKFKTDNLIRNKPRNGRPIRRVIQEIKKDLQKAPGLL